METTIRIQVDVRVFGDPPPVQAVIAWAKASLTDPPLPSWLRHIDTVRATPVTAGDLTKPTSLTRAHLVAGALAHIEANAWSLQTTGFHLDQENKTATFFQVGRGKPRFLEAVNFNALGRKLQRALPGEGGPA